MPDTANQWRSRCAAPPPPELRQAVEEFNAGLYFEQHETLEAIWLEEDAPLRYLYQGILQVGVGCLHLTRGNAHGAEKLWRRGADLLEPFAPVCRGVDVADLLAATCRCLAELARVGPTGLADFDASLFPRVRLVE